jgi:hypothetical protein
MTIIFKLYARICHQEKPNKPEGTANELGTSDSGLR